MNRNYKILVLSLHVYNGQILRSSFLSADKLHIFRAFRPIYGIVPCCDADIYIPYVSRLVRGPLSTLSNVKQTVLPLAVQYNTAPRSTRYTSHGPSGPDPF